MSPIIFLQLLLEELHLFFRRKLFFGPGFVRPGFSFVRFRVCGLGLPVVSHNEFTQL